MMYNSLVSGGAGSGTLREQGIPQGQNVDGLQLMTGESDTFVVIIIGRSNSL